MRRDRGGERNYAIFRGDARREFIERVRVVAIAWKEHDERCRRWTTKVEIFEYRARKLERAFNVRRSIARRRRERGRQQLRGGVPIEDRPQVFPTLCVPPRDKHIFAVLARLSAARKFLKLVICPALDRSLSLDDDAFRIQNERGLELARRESGRRGRDDGSPTSLRHGFIRHAYRGVGVQGAYRARVAAIVRADIRCPQPVQRRIPKNERGRIRKPQHATECDECDARHYFPPRWSSRCRSCARNDRLSLSRSPERSDST